MSLSKSPNNERYLIDAQNYLLVSTVIPKVLGWLISLKYNDKRPDETVHAYLLRTGRSCYGRKYLRLCSTIDNCSWQISNFSDLDILSLFKMFRSNYSSCEWNSKVSSLETLEAKVNNIINSRNSIIHAPNENPKKISLVLESNITMLIHHTAEQFHVSTREFSDFKSSILMEISKVKKSIKLSYDCEFVVWSLTKMGKLEYRNKLRNASTNSNFFELKLIDNSQSTINSIDIVRYAVHELKTNILIISGDAGSGKTRLLEEFMKRWTEGDIMTLHDLYIIIKMPFYGGRSLGSLVKSCYPETVGGFTNKQIELALEQLKVVFLIDDVDIATSDEISFVTDLANRAKELNWSLILSSRPSSISKLRTEIKDVIVAKIKPFEDIERKEFVETVFPGISYDALRCKLNEDVEKCFTKPSLLVLLIEITKMEEKNRKDQIIVSESDLYKRFTRQVEIQNKTNFGAHEKDNKKYKDEIALILLIKDIKTTEYLKREENASRHIVNCVMKGESIRSVISQVTDHSIDRELLTR